MMVTTALLALAAVASAQDRNDDKDRRDGSSKSDHSSRSRSDRDVRDSGDRRSHSDDRRSRDDVRSSDRAPSSGRPTSSNDRTDRRSDPFGRSRSDRDDRGSGSAPTRRDDRPQDTSRPSPERSNRPGDRPTPTERGNDRSGPARQDDRRQEPQRTAPVVDHRNPFGRRDDRRNEDFPSRQDDRRGGDVGRTGVARPHEEARRYDPAIANPRGRAVLGVPVHDHSPAYWDGRGHATATRYDAPPRRNFLSVQINNGAPYRGTEVAVGARIGGLRVGFVSYSDPGFHRDYGYAGYGYNPRPFGYSHYCYDPYVPGAVVVASPWYRYSYLPPYLDRSQVIVVNDYPSWNWDSWRRYDYDGGRDDHAVRDAIDDLREGFEREDTRTAGRLIPNSGSVAIFNEGHYDYSLNPDDFEKMFLDGVEQSKTVSYRIEETRTRGDEIRIRARHEYTDSWGETQSVIHTLTLRRERGGDYVIREFGSE